VPEATGKSIARTTLADPVGYRLGVTQQIISQTGIYWAYEGETYGYRVEHLYFPRSGMIIALAVNSATGNDDLADLADRSTRHCRKQAQYTPAEYGAAAADTGQATQPGLYPGTRPPRA
jgi:hypothetical protein